MSLSASDATSGATLKYFAVGLPPGLHINPSSGVITGTVATNDAAYGPYAVTVLATDGTASATETFTWSVSSPITFAAVAGQSNNESDTVSVSAGASDSSGGSTLKYGAIGLPDGLKINPSTGAITGTLALGTAANGSYTITVLAGDGTYSSSQIISWGASNAITFNQPADQSNYEEDTISLSISASDTSGAVTYSALGLPPGLKLNTSSGAITGTLAVGTAATGSYAVVVTAGDGTFSSSRLFTWTVNDPIVIVDPGVQDFSEGNFVSFQIHASDTTNSALNYSVTGSPLGLAINALTGVFSGTINAVGSFPATIHVTDGLHNAYETLVFNVLAPGAGLTSTLLLAPPNATDVKPEAKNVGDGPQTGFSPLPDDQRISTFNTYWGVGLYLDKAGLDELNKAGGGYIVSHRIITWKFENYIGGNKEGYEGKAEGSVEAWFLDPISFTNGILNANNDFAGGRGGARIMQDDSRPVAYFSVINGYEIPFTKGKITVTMDYQLYSGAITGKFPFKGSPDGLPSGLGFDEYVHKPWATKDPKVVGKPLVTDKLEATITWDGQSQSFESPNTNLSSGPQRKSRKAVFPPWQYDANKMKWIRAQPRGNEKP